jgi:adenosylcobinamide amidohydrolase
MNFDQPPEIRLRTEGGHTLAARLWRLVDPMLAISSTPLGGGLGLRDWVINAQVPRDYDCDDPQSHLRALAAEAGLAGPGAGMMTAVDVRRASVVRQEDIYVDATVGIAGPQWAASDDVWPEHRSVAPGPAVGTINLVVVLPERLSEGALVNAVGTATEAKTQALWERGVGGTGTATDALCILCPSEGAPHPYGGPRSTWGSRLARVVRLAVLSGCAPIGTP